MTQCQVLGPVRVVDVGGRRLTLASDAQRRLVAMLCLRAGSPTRSVVLEEQLGLSAGALRTSISRLRHVVGPDAIVSESAGYTLVATVDAVEYERLVEEAFAADAPRARWCLEQADLLWRGPPYEEFAHEPWAEAEARRLAELHSSAMAESTLLLLDAHETAAAVAAAQCLVEAEPYRDIPRALLMRALVRAGRRTEALRAFQDYHRLLQDEIGTTPTDPLVELDLAIASEDDLEALGRSGHPAWIRRRGTTSGAAPARPAALPIPVSSFVGRAAEIGEVAALLASHRLVTLTGSGGCGKSRLALRLASTAPERDGSRAWWVELGVLSPGGDVAEQVAAAIGVRPGRGILAELADRLRGERSLVVLDNAEHVLDEVGRVAMELLTRNPDTRALVTSRQPLGLPGEVVWRVPELSMPDDVDDVTLDTFDRHDALRLFLIRAREARPGMVVDARAVRQIASICRELDGMPLGLELAAARLRNLPLERVADGISEAVRWRAGGRSRPARHESLRASIEWTVGLISPFEQRALVGLATFRSPFDVAAAAAVIDTIADGADVGEAHAVDCVGRLTDVGLLQLDDSSGRYRMLSTVRQFCLDIGRASGDLDRAEAAHARHVASWCESVGEGRLGIEHHRFTAFMPDVVAASNWARARGDRDTVFAICSGLAPVRSALGQHTDVLDTWSWLQTIDADERTPAWAEAAAGLLATATSQIVETGSVVEEILLHLGPGSVRASGWLERGRAMEPAYRGRPSAIRSYADGLLARGDDLEASVYVGFAAYMQALVGRLAECDRMLDQLRQLTRRHACAFSVDSVGNGFAAAIVSETLRGELGPALDRGRRPTPRDPAFAMTSAAALAHAALLAGDRHAMDRALHWAAQGSFPLLSFLTPFSRCCAALLDGDTAEAAERALDASDRFDPVPVWWLYATPVIVSALVSGGESAQAASFVDLGVGMVEQMESAPLPSACAHLGRAQIALAQGRADAVRQHSLAALAEADAGRLPLAVIDALDLLASVEGSSTVPRSVIARAAAAERRRTGLRFRLAPSTPTVPAREGDGHLEEVVGALLRPE